jgi:hypothetical protein
LPVGGKGKKVARIIKVGYQYLIERDPKSPAVEKAHVTLKD